MRGVWRKDCGVLSIRPPWAPILQQVEGVEMTMTVQEAGRKGGLSRRRKYRPSRRKAQAMARASHVARKRNKQNNGSRGAASAYPGSTGSAPRSVSDASKHSP